MYDGMNTFINSMVCVYLQRHIFFCKDMFVLIRLYVLHQMVQYHVLKVTCLCKCLYMHLNTLSQELFIFDNIIKLFNSLEKKISLYHISYIYIFSKCLTCIVARFYMSGVPKDILCRSVFRVLFLRITLKKFLHTF